MVETGSYFVSLIRLEVQSTVHDQGFVGGDIVHGLTPRLGRVEESLAVAGVSHTLNDARHIV